MPIAGKGMLLTSMDVDAADEPDQPLVRSRTSRGGAWLSTASSKHGATSPIAAARKISSSIPRDIDVLDSPAYRARLANPTERSRKNMAHSRT